MFKGLNRSLPFEFKTVVPVGTTLLCLCVERAEQCSPHCAEGSRYAGDAQDVCPLVNSTRCLLL